jgi:hypothetical protein
MVCTMSRASSIDALMRAGFALRGARSFMD